MSSLICQTLLIAFLISLVVAYFEVDVQSIEQLSDTKYGDLSKIKIRKDKASKTRGFYGNVSLNLDVDNSFKLSVIFTVKQGGEYRRMPYKLPPKGICDAINEDQYVYPELAENSNFLRPVPCPIPTGVYEILGYEPSLKNAPKMIMHTGDYAPEIQLIKDGQVVFSVKIYGSIINL